MEKMSKKTELILDSQAELGEGPELDTLYITSARSGLSAEQFEQEPHAGGLFAIQPGTQGLPAFRFGG